MFTPASVISGWVELSSTSRLQAHATPCNIALYRAGSGLKEPLGNLSRTPTIANERKYWGRWKMCHLKQYFLFRYNFRASLDYTLSLYWTAVNFDPFCFGFGILEWFVKISFVSCHWFIVKMTSMLCFIAIVAALTMNSMALYPFHASCQINWLVSQWVGCWWRTGYGTVNRVSLKSPPTLPTVMTGPYRSVVSTEGATKAKKVQTCNLNN